MGPSTLAELSCAPGPWSELERGARGQGERIVSRKAFAKLWEYATLLQSEKVTVGKGALSSLAHSGLKGNVWKAYGSMANRPKL